ncbi:hypothetical protein BC827DRAFT_1194810 [Russula dissimulans]|nr:hypothetical protein BC827DRAFT_1194810 [Russula dissimulans]
MSSYNRWVRDEDDRERLPIGMVRTGYDADDRQYTFLETASHVKYVSAPGEAYGTLVPAATANFPKHSRSAGRRRTLQAYERPVLFAEDVGVQRRSSPSASPHHHSTSTRKRGHRQRSASFSDFLPPHLIAPAPPPNSSSGQGRRSAEPGRRQQDRGWGGDPPKSAPLTRTDSSSPFRDEKKSPWWPSSSSPEPGDQALSSLPSLPSLPPPPPPKDSLSSSGFDRRQVGMSTPRVALRFTARVLERTLGAVKGGGYRSRVGLGQSKDDEWVVV